MNKSGILFRPETTNPFRVHDERLDGKHRGHDNNRNGKDSGETPVHFEGPLAGHVVKKERHGQQDKGDAGPVRE